MITTKEGEEKTISFDTVVVAAGGRPNQSLLRELTATMPEVHLAGDCVEPRGIAEAMADGLRIGLEI